MKRIMATLALMGSLMTASSQTLENVANATVAEQTVSDRLALKELVDVFSCLADTKEVNKQVMLFTDDAVVDSYRDNKLISSIKGRDSLAIRFGAFLDRFETVYHINGQQVTTISGEKATGTAYCLVVLIGNDGGKRNMLTQGVRYEDEYVKRNNQWLISKRTSHFLWSDTKEMGE